MSVQMPFFKGETSWFQTEVKLESKRKGCHLVTDEVERKVPEIRKFKVGIMNLFLQHTSASLTVNENASPDVRYDLNEVLDRLVPEDDSLYRHTEEGSDDMPAHGKSTLCGCHLSIPIREGRLAMGIWQGIYLCEHRNYGGSRHIVVTIQGILY